MASTCILNYGAGNIRSVFNLFSVVGGNPKMSNDAQDIADASHLVLPGVGAFGEAMQSIRRLLPLATIERELERGKPFLGICVGMQVLATRGLEMGEHQGLNWIPGTVDRVPAGCLRLPHIGWNGVSPTVSHPLTMGLGENADVYFVHSYAFAPDRREHVLATTTYGDEFCCMVGSANILGVQFHPEKSQGTGFRLIENFLRLS